MNHRAFRPTFAVACFLLLLVSREGQAVVDPDERYQAGLDAAQAERWEQALEAFAASLNAREDSLTLYMLSVCASQLRRAQDAKDYALTALKSPPPLQPELDRHARAILKWAGVVLLSPQRIRARFEMEAETDAVNRDLISDQAQRTAIEDYYREVRESVAPYIDLDQLDLEILLLASSHPCSSPNLPSQVNACLQSIFNEEDYLPSPPDAKLPSNQSEPPAEDPPTAEDR